MLTDGFSELTEESQQVLEAGIRGAEWLHVDDTGARHRHKNGCCTVIGNDQFTCFASRGCKTRLNFLLLLHGSDPEYVLNEAAFEYMGKRKLAKRTQQLLRSDGQVHFESEAKWKAPLQKLGIVKPNAVTFATEAALWGG